MSLRLGDTAPDFSADTTAGPIDFHRWAGEAGVVLEDVIIVPAVTDEEARG
jgi:alkyl hydroperoxide reductase subunit AhpC